MKKIALIPIDNRPVCYKLIKQIIGLSKEHQLFMPDISYMGGLEKNAQINEILKWLENLKEIDAAVISLDTVAYGGLIPSRRSNDDLDTIKERINRLKNILEKKSAKIYAFSSIMRISNNNINEEEKLYWNHYGTKIFDYSYNKHKFEINNSDENLAVLNNLVAKIPEEILNDYLKTRERNFEINKYYIELAKQGLFHTLVFSKDDCVEYGLNIKEAQKLKEYSKDFKNIYIKTGADEIPLTLLSRAIMEGKHIKISPVYLNPESINKISKYEDITVKESVESQIELAGGILSDIKNSDLIMLVNNFKTQQGDPVMGCSTQLFEGCLKIPDKPYFIADIVNANGADNNFIKELFKKDSLKQFFGYAGWNTTGNTLGSAIAAALIYFTAKHPDKRGFLNLQMTRFLDDWAYQANVRQVIKDNIDNISDEIVKEKMQSFEEQLFQKFDVKRMKVNYSFPWNRFFEIEISLHPVYTNIPFIDILFYE